MKKDLLTSTFERLHRRLFIKARRLLDDDEDARDVLQDAFFKLWQRHRPVNSESHATGLLVTTVRTLSIDRLRQRQSRQEAPAETETLPDQPAVTDDDERMETLRRVESLARLHLSERDREILYRRDRDEWSFEEIGEAFGVTAANARLIVARARKSIRTLYNSYND